MDYRKKVKNRLYRCIISIICGVIIFIVSFFNDTVGSPLAGCGSAIVVVGIMNFMRNKKMLKNPEKLQQSEITEKDERNIMIDTKAKSLAFNVYILISFFLMLILFMTEYAYIAEMISYMTCALLVIYFICYIILQKKY